MRDFRDAKAMARALRDTLKGKALEITHSESLELIAKAFGYENWNVLSAKIDAAQSRARDERKLSPAAEGRNPPTTLYCSFCHKSQHQVRKLIAGPGVYICDECVEICRDIIGEGGLLWQVLALLFKAAEQGANDSHLSAFEYVRGKPTDEVVSYVATGKRFAEHNRLTLDCIRRRLAMGDGEVPAEDILASPRFVYLNENTSDELRDMQQETQRTLKLYEDAVQIGTKVLGERKR